LRLEKCSTTREAERNFTSPQMLHRRYMRPLSWIAHCLYGDFRARRAALRAPRPFGRRFQGGIFDNRLGLLDNSYQPGLKTIWTSVYPHLLFGGVSWSDDLAQRSNQRPRAQLLIRKPKFKIHHKIPSIHPMIPSRHPVIPQSAPAKRTSERPLHWRIACLASAPASPSSHRVDGQKRA
jgi:hypothetical protein